MTNNQKSYLVVWRGDEAEFFQSQVCIGVNDPKQMANSDWVEEASKTEGYSESETEELLATSYELILVCDFPETFYND